MSQNIGIIAFKLVKWGWFLNDWGKEIQITMVIVVFMLSNICSSKLAYTVYSKKQNKASFPNSFYVSYNEPYEKNFSTK